MRAIVKTSRAPGVNYVDDAPAPEEPSYGEVKVAIAAASVCGTDREIVKYSPAAQAFHLRLPVITGHEGSGVVVSIGDGVTSVSVGDRVAFDSHVACFECYQCSIGNSHICERMLLLGLHIDGLFAEQVIVPARAVYRLPHDFPLETAALLEPAGVAMHAIQSCGQSLLGLRVLISGGGPVGLLIAELARLGGAAVVAVIEPNTWRREFAESRGAIGVDATAEGNARLSALAAARGGFDVGFEASGHPSAFDRVVAQIRKGGHYVSVGFGGTAVALDTSEVLNRRSITLHGSFGRRLWSTWDLLVALVIEGRLDLEAFITHRLKLDEFDRAIELLSEDSCKVLVLPQS